ncbi:hypothetical protein HY990_05790 [Candidatus Micrarchaeota archaeon]|nr:hypothetical protein [Candidatus Micrarchaeota archaeon]
MQLKAILTLAISAFFIAPGLLSVFLWSVSLNSHSPEENVKTGVELIVDQAMPWWLGLVSLAATLGSFGIVIFVFIAIVIRITGIRS